MGVTRKVLIFGGGIGGLSAAHELTEGERADHFEVEVVEGMRDLQGQPVYGGKAFSETVRGDPPDDVHGYPGEHGFRFFPTFYRHVVDTMRRIPGAYQASGRATVADHLVSTPSRMLARYGKAPITMPSAPPLNDPGRIAQFLLELFGADTHLTTQDALDFALKLLQLATTCKSRRLAEYQTQSWWKFIEADTHSEYYQRYFANGLTRTLVAASPREINAKTGGDVLVRLLVDSSIPIDSDIPEILTRASADRILDGPTSEVWIRPWLEVLERRKVSFSPGRLVSLTNDGEKIVRADVIIKDGSVKTLKADYYIIALPVEKFATVLDDSPAVRDAGERFNQVSGELRNHVRSMTGLQFYLDRELQHVDPDLGHALYVDTPWAFTSIAQSHFWKPPYDDLSRWGRGNVKTIWSTIASDWKTPADETDGLDANHCTRQQLRDFTLEQLKKSLNGDGTVRFDPSWVIAWNLDSSVTPGPEIGTGTPAENRRLLLINKPGSWDYRPDPAPAGLTNLLLAADFVRTNTDLATMEAANEAARVAVNAILDREGIGVERCSVFELYYPEVLTSHFDDFAAVERFDEELFGRGLAWDLSPKLKEWMERVR